MTKRQTGIRVELSLYIPYDPRDMKGAGAAIALAEKLKTREGLAEAKNMQDVEIESASARQITRDAPAAPAAVAGA